ncbi:MAG: hypothetical protein AABX32_07235 [Nanoarchaeota archaeon]
MIQVYSISDLVLAQNQAHREFERNPTLWQAVSNLMWYYNARFQLCLILSESQLGKGIPEFDRQFCEEFAAGRKNYLNSLFAYHRKI